MPVRSILKATRFALADETNPNRTDHEYPSQLTISEKHERVSPRKVITTTITEEYRCIQRRIVEEIGTGYYSIRSYCSNFYSLSNIDEQEQEQEHKQSNYSSKYEQLPCDRSLTASVPLDESSIYESLSDCYSGYSSTQNEFRMPLKAPLVSNVTSLVSTADEAYESDPARTISPTMSSSTGMTITHVHPDLENEFEFPSPPPPVPDRRLKPVYLRSGPPAIKPRTPKQHNNTSNADESQQKVLAPSLSVIQHIVASTSNDETTIVTRAMSSRHYCGTLPMSNPLPTSSNNIETKSKTHRDSTKRNSKTLSCLTNTTNDEQQQHQQQHDVIFSKSSMNGSRAKKSSMNGFDEMTNGLAIRLPASIDNESDSNEKSVTNRFVN
jgi:hypothetical protein